MPACCRAALTCSTKQPSLKWNRGPEPWWPCAARYVSKAAIGQISFLPRNIETPFLYGSVFEAFIDTLTIMGLAGLPIAMSSIAKLTEGSKLLSD